MKFHDHITDSELLEQFTLSGSQAAFATLVKRHGAMVRAVAMRVLAMASETRATKLSVREPSDNLSKMSKEEFYTLMISVALISDEAERLVAIREKLGMNISDEVYRKALADHGYLKGISETNV